jgi:antitoxin (DNA-binding transcriptional repressor) of toxin-antitoxin stability system
MPTTTVDVQELPSRLMELIALVATGTEVIVMEGTIPRARIVPISAERARVAGLHPEAIKITPDFDAALPDDFWLGKS